VSALLNRRQALSALAGAASAMPLILRSAPRSETRIASTAVARVAATWRGPDAHSAYQAGILEFDAGAGEIRILWQQRLPGRAHGLVAASDGGVLVLAVRPGYWIRHFSASGRMQCSLDIPADAARHLTGHAAVSRDGAWLYTGETDARDDSGWVGVRDLRTLQMVDEWQTHGVEPHDLRLAPDGSLILANGGIRRAAGDRKRALDRMDSSIVNLDATSGALRGQWRLEDSRLSLRHLAWTHSLEGRPLLGIGIQAEHQEPERRRDAPLLALWDGSSLSVPSHAAGGDGYAGDICAAPGGGFVISSNRVNSALWWHPSVPGKLTLVARLTEAYALSSHMSDATPDGVFISAARGAALWNPLRAAALLPWPQAMVTENHWLSLAT
jgi:hypothetical protein